MRTVCNNTQCVGCKACINCCPTHAIAFEDSLEEFNAVINKAKCINCGTCYNVCQVNHPIEMVYPRAWYQGWANDEDIRRKASSGGIASSIMLSFLQTGGAVCSCEFHAGEFSFCLTHESNKVKEFRGSKYVKSDMGEAYVEIKKTLEKGEKVLFIGLPCQSAGLQKYLPTKCLENLYTVDLICHGTPSPKILRMYLQEKDVDIAQAERINFRAKDTFKIEYEGEAIEHGWTCDKYSIAFLNAISYTENCYSCVYAQIARVSDLTLGDSWGSELPISEQKKGISLILCQTEKGKELLELADLHLETVDLEKAVKSNHQLREPSKYQSNRKLFFDMLKRKGMSAAVWKCYPLNCFKQVVRSILPQQFSRGGGKI